MEVSGQLQLPVRQSRGIRLIGCQISGCGRQKIIANEFPRKVLKPPKFEQLWRWTTLTDVPSGFQASILRPLYKKRMSRRQLKVIVNFQFTALSILNAGPSKLISGCYIILLPLLNRKYIKTQEHK
jgi:hypothetical protein